MGHDRNADRKVLAWPGVIAAALVAAPVEQQLDHADAAQELGSLLAERWQQEVLRPHGRAEADHHRLLAKRRGEGAEPPGALQRDRLGVEGSGHNHGPIQPDQRFAVLRKLRQVAKRPPLRVEVAGACDRESDDLNHRADFPGDRMLRRRHSIREIWEYARH